MRLLASIAAPEAPYGLSLDDIHHRLWVTLTGTNLVAEYDVGRTPPATFATVRQPNSVAVDPDRGRVYIIGTADGALQIFRA